MGRWLNDNFLLNLARNRACIENYSCKIHQFEPQDVVAIAAVKPWNASTQNSLFYVLDERCQKGADV